MAGLVAYVDESFHEHPTDGFYVLAAAVFNTEAYATEAYEAEAYVARAAMLGLRGRRRTDKLHWNEMDHRQQHMAARTVSGLAGVHLVTIGTPVPQRKQERARRASLRRLVYELHGLGVTQIMMDPGSAAERHFWTRIAPTLQVSDLRAPRRSANPWTHVRTVFELVTSRSANGTRTRSPATLKHIHGVAVTLTGR